MFRQLEKSDYILFFKSLYDARLVNKYGCYLTLGEPERYLKTQNFLLGDGIAGFAIDNGDLIAVHKNPEKARKNKVSGVIDEIVPLALKNGATKLDCYGSFLANAYMSFGFLPTGRMKFNPIYNPEWNIERYGTPDVIVFCRAVSDIDELIQLTIEDKFIGYEDISDKLTVYDDYQTMLEDRDRVLETVQASKYGYFDTLRYITSRNKVKEEEYGD